MLSVSNAARVLASSSTSSSLVSLLLRLVHMGNMMNAGASPEPGHIPACSEEDRQLAGAAVSKLATRNISLLAFDFDQTLVTCHTRGAWKQSASKLAELVRPCLIALIHAALEANIHVGIVTYSMQPKLIEDVLALVLSERDAKRVIIRGNTKDWERLQGVSILGKQQHLASILQEVNSKEESSDHQITGDQVLLLDDDGDNVKIAEAFGHNGFVVEDDVKLEKLILHLDGIQ